jgi:hypothetical protein
MSAVIVDANLLLLLVVGAADRRYIAMHGNLSHYSVEDFELLIGLIGLFDEIVLVPHVLAEVSNLAAQSIKNPAKRHIFRQFRQLIETTQELPVASVQAVFREEFIDVGLNDSVLLQLCEASTFGLEFTILTADKNLAVKAEMLGYSVQNFSHWK